VESMILVVPPGGETVALRVFNLLHYGHNALVNALCLTLLALAVAPLLAWKAWRVASGEWPLLTRHASRITPLFACALAFLLNGCAPRMPSDQTRLHSRIFRAVQVIGSRGVGVGQLNKPRSVAMDEQDNLYVVDMTGRVQKFSSNGVFLLSWQMPQTDLGKPKGMCRDRNGNILVLEPHYQRVNVFSPEGKLLAQWGKRGTNAAEFMLPRAVAVDSRGEVFVSEYGLVERVQRFAPHGEKLLAGIGHAGNAPGEFNRPEGVCLDAQDRLYVADSCNHRIQVFSREGKLIRAYGKPGKGIGELSYPYDICVDAAGRQYVCEFGNSRIQVFDANHRPLEIIGGPGLAPGQFNDPWGVALDSAGNLYVADSQNHRVQKLIR
jgi:DNA-binding beta-propeller fold protein YncE